MIEVAANGFYNVSQLSDRGCGRRDNLLQLWQRAGRAPGDLLQRNLDATSRGVVRLHPSPGRAIEATDQFDLAAVSQSDRLVGGGSLVLFIALFLPWFSVKAGPFGGSASALSAHGYMYITLILSLAIIALVAAEVLGLWKLPSTIPLGREQLLLIATVINLVLVLIAFLFKPSGLGVVHVGWSWGAFVGLIAAVVAAFPLAWPVIQARRSK
jgi:hypothetical protein